MDARGNPGRQMRQRVTFRTNAIFQPCANLPSFQNFDFCRRNARTKSYVRFSFSFLSISRHDYINMKRASSIFRRENTRGNNNNSFSRGRQLDEHANFILVEERVFAMFFEPCFPRSYRPPRSNKFFSNHFRELDSNSSNSREGG